MGYAQAPNHAESAGCSASRRSLAGPRRCRRGRGHIGREGISGRVCAGLRRNAGLACRRFWTSNHPANLRRAAKTHTHSRSSSRKPRQSVPKSSSCDGLRMADARFEKLCASSGISVPLKQYARSRNARLTSRVSRFLNWSLCLTSVEERLAPRSRVSASLEFAARWVPAQTNGLEAQMTTDDLSVNGLAVLCPQPSPFLRATT